MLDRTNLVGATLATILLLGSTAGAVTLPEINAIARCQRTIAFAGAQFAQRTIRATLKCTNSVTECQVQCEYGVFGPSCSSSGPPCCDPDDPASSASFGECMADADEDCAKQNSNIINYELQKQIKITKGCEDLSTDQLCGASGEGLNFATLNAGCQALDAGYTCSLSGFLGCVGGPLQRRLTGQISSLLDPRAPEAIAALGLQGQFPGIPVTRKRGEDLPAAGKMDVWTFSGQAGDEIVLRIKNKDDTGSGQSTLAPLVTLLGTDLATPVADTSVSSNDCPVTSACGAQCPTFKRVLPFSGTFGLVVRSAPIAGCGAGGYRLVVTSTGGGTPVLVADDVNVP